MEYYTVEEARNLPGLRLVLSAHVPGPWGESAKALFKLRGVDYKPVEQQPMQPNEALLEWTGVRNAPVAVPADGPPVTNWLDFVMLAERLGSGPSLLPSAELERALCLGLSAEICGREGLGWVRRHLIFAKSWGDEQAIAAASDHERNLMRSYGYTLADAEAAPVRMAAILDGLASQLRRQRDAGSDYLVGTSLSACDVHWAFFSIMLDPLAHDANPMPDFLRALYADVPDTVTDALDPALIEHRDFILEKHIGLPLDY